LFYAPFLVWMGGGLVKILDTGVRVLPQREWEERERSIYAALRGSTVRIEPDGSLVLPRLRGETLSSLLESPSLDEPARKRAIELAVVALSEFHRSGNTHGDAMAENVLVDLDAGAAHLFDFETVHDPDRTMQWRRADDVRAMLATCLVRTAPEYFTETIQLIIDTYADDEVAGLVAEMYSSPLRRPLALHLGQAALGLEQYREIGQFLRARRASVSADSHRSGASFSHELLS
jgi:serine/threonine protein kinase